MTQIFILHNMNLQQLVEKIRGDYLSGSRICQLVKQYDLKFCTIHAVVRNKNWKNPDYGKLLERQAA